MTTSPSKAQHATAVTIVCSFPAQSHRPEGYVAVITEYINIASFL
jgi:hypothetical protein